MAKKPFHLFALAATHLAAIGIGWAIWSATHTRDDVAGKSREAAFSASELRHRERRAERSEHGLSGDEILKKIETARIGNSPPTSRRFSFGDYLFEQSARISKAADELEPAADVAAAAIDALEIISKRKPGEPLTQEMIAEMQQAPARLLHWMRKDPAAAIAYAINANGRENSSNHEAVLFAAIAEKGIVAGSEWTGLGPQSDSQIRRAITILGGRDGDAGSLVTVQSKFTPQQWQDMRTEIAKNWPAEKSDQLLDYALAQNAPGALLAHVSKQGKKGYEWLTAKMASGEIDPTFAAAFTKTNQYRELFINNPDIPFDDRVAGLSLVSPAKTQEQIKLEIGTKDVTDALNKGRDWRYAFRNGAASLDEIYNAIAADLPELANGSPAAIKNQLFKELAEDNGTAAMGLLDGMPETEKWETALKPARWMFFGVNPQEFYNFLQQIPANPSPEAWQARLESWSAHSAPNHQQLGSEYVDWVKNLPDGPDREMASYILIRDLGKANPELAESLKPTTKDERLLQRLAPKP